ncbi:hypothetical protein [Pseudomonas sp.]|uniref:hypothetical protein n=1 Tax=Pseudomonas sp. TaxID=306 RepID=UPI0028A96F4A|nr:hypothetical protein [Pseudomonas sp.]
MTKRGITLDAATAFNYLSKTVLIELRWDDEPESYWCCEHIVGVVLPMEGVHEHAYFLAINVASDRPYPNEVFFSDIRTIRVMRHRDRQGSGNVLGRIALPNRSGSGAALPARRNGSIVPSNGSTGAAHP